MNLFGRQCVVSPHGLLLSVAGAAVYVCALGTASSQFNVGRNFGFILEPMN